AAVVAQVDVALAVEVADHLEVFANADGVVATEVEGVVSEVRGLDHVLNCAASFRTVGDGANAGLCGADDTGRFGLGLYLDAVDDHRAAEVGPVRARDQSVPVVLHARDQRETTA